MPDQSGSVTVADRGAREIVVFLEGIVDGNLSGALDDAIDQVAQLEELNALDHAVVDMHKVAALHSTGIAFLRELTQRGRRAGFDVSFAQLSGPAHRAVENAGWPFMEHSPPPIPEQRTAQNVNAPETFSTP